MVKYNHMNREEILKGSALVIVAHPDDETIWMGGTIMKNPQVDWTIFSICRKSDPDRMPKFMKVAERYGAKALIEDVEDDGKMGVQRSVPVIRDLILSAVKKQKFDFLFTHGRNGEYGHSRHKGVHLAVRELVKGGNLNIGRTLFFNYKKISQEKFSQVTFKRNSTWLVRLTKEEAAAKKDVMIGYYGFDKDGIDANLCTNPEAFIEFRY